MKIIIEGWSPTRDEYVPVTVDAELDRFGYLDGWKLLEIEAHPVHTDHASIWADELGITDEQIENVARQEAGLNEVGFT